MNEAVLSYFRHLAKGLTAREKTGFTVILANGREVKVLYDPLFKTITMGGMTFPAKELAIWTKLSFRSLPVRIITDEGK